MKSLTNLTILITAITCCSTLTRAADDKVNFEDHIKPIFRQKCASCHNTNKKTADLDLTNYTALMQGGGSGAAIEPGSPDDSYLFMLVNHDSEPYMPPKSDKLPEEMIATLKKWIEIGAPETSSSKVMLPKKPKVDLSVDVSAGARPEGPPPMPDVLNLQPVIHTSTTTAVSAIATSPWAKLVAVAGQKQVILYNSETLHPLGVLPFPEGQARVLKFSRSGALLLAGGGHGASKGLAVVWDVRTGERVMQAGDELDEVLAADISADQSMIALGGPAKIVRVYSTATGELQYEIKKHTDWVTSLEFSPDSVLLATGDRAGGLHVWEAYTGRQYLTLNGHKGAITGTSWRIDSNVLASASADATIKLWEMENGGAIKSWTAHGGGVTSIEFCRDGRIASCGRDKVTKLWDQNGKQLIAFEAFGDLALQVSHCDETNRVIAGDWTGEVRVWNAADGKRVGNLSTNPPPLETRLAQAEAAVAPVAAKLTEARNQLQSATAARDAHIQTIEKAKQAMAAAQKALADAQALLKRQQAAVAQLQKKQAETTARLTALQKAVPELKAAMEKATTASTMMQDDAELKAAIAGLTKQVADRTAELQQTDAALKQLTAELAKQQQTVKATEKQIADANTKATAEKANVEKLSAALKPFEEKVAAANAAVNSAASVHAKAVAEVQKWKEYIALRDELQILRDRKAEREKLELAALEAEAALQQVLQQKSAAETLLAAKTKQQNELTTKQQQLKQQIAKLQAQVTAMAASAGTQEQALPMLQAAVQQVNTASQMLPDDKDIKGSVDTLQKLIAARNESLSKLKEQINAMNAQLAQMQATLNTTVAAVAAVGKEAAAAKTQIDQLTAQAAPLQKAAEEARTRFAAADTQWQKAQAVVESRKQKLRPQLQVTQASIK